MKAFLIAIWLTLLASAAAAQVLLTGAGPAGSLCAATSAPAGGLFDSANYSSFSGSGNNATVATNQVTSPACAVTGATITEDSTASAAHYGSAFYSGSLTAQQYTFTSFIKQANTTSGARNYEGEVFSSAFSSSAFVYATLPACTQLVAPTVTGSFSSPSVTLTLQSNGWCKVALHYTGISDTGVFLLSILSSGSSGTYSGNGTSSLGAWGADFRTGIGP